MVQKNHHTKRKELLYLNSHRDFAYSWILHEMNATAIDCQKTGLSFLQPGNYSQTCTLQSSDLQVRTRQTGGRINVTTSYAQIMLSFTPS